MSLDRERKTLCDILLKTMWIGLIQFQAGLFSPKPIGHDFRNVQLAVLHRLYFFFLFHSASVKGRKNCVNNGLNRMRQWPVTPKIYGNQPFGKCVSRNFDSICCISMSCNWTIFMAIVQCRHNFQLVGKSLCWDLTSRGSWIQGGKKTLLWVLYPFQNTLKEADRPKGKFNR